MLIDVILNVTLSYIMLQFDFVPVCAGLRIRQGVSQRRQAGLNRTIERACEEEKVK